MNINELEIDIQKNKERSPETFNEIVNITLPFYMFYRKMFGGVSRLEEDNYQITHSEIDVLSSLKISGNEEYILSPTRLNERLLFTAGAITKVLKKLEEKEYIESIFPFSNVKPEFFLKAQALIKKRYELTSLTFTKTKDIMPYVDKMFDLFNNSYADLSSFVAITDVQKEYFKKKYISFINPEYIKFVMDKNDNIVAFSIVMPSFSEALQKAKGKLFPFGFYHLLNARKNSKDVVFYLIGVDPEYQNKGVTAIIFDEYFKTFSEKGIVNCIRTPELEENHAIHNLWKNFDPRIHCRRKTFIKNL